MRPAERGERFARDPRGLPRKWGDSRFVSSRRGTARALQHDLSEVVIMKKLLATLVLGLGIAALLPTGCGLGGVQAPLASIQ
jgi:hypothetical protein